MMLRTVFWLLITTALVFLTLAIILGILFHPLNWLFLIGVFIVVLMCFIIMGRF